MSGKSFWTTVPGIITGITATITAITGLIAVINPKPQQPSVATTTNPGAQQPSPSVATTIPVNCKNVVDDPDPPLNVRVGPGVNFEVVGTLPNETPISVVENNGKGWLRITSPQSGWVTKKRTRTLCNP